MNAPTTPQEYFLEFKRVFLLQCKRYALPPPEIRLALPTDVCDFTSPQEVRLNIQCDACAGGPVSVTPILYFEDGHQEETTKPWVCPVCGGTGIALPTMSAGKRAAHNWGHWLCDIHQEGVSGNSPEIEWADVVADVIADLFRTGI